MGRPRKTQVQNDFNAALGMRIQKIRRARKMKCSQFARELGLVYQQVYAYEAGIATIPPHMLVLMAHALGVGVADLMPITREVSRFNFISENARAEKLKCV